MCVNTVQKYKKADNIITKQSKEMADFVTVKPEVRNPRVFISFLLQSNNLKSSYRTKTCYRFTPEAPNLHYSLQPSCNSCNNVTMGYCSHVEQTSSPCDKLSLWVVKCINNILVISTINTLTLSCLKSGLVNAFMTVFIQ